MMATIVHFVPRQELSSLENLNAFISLARDKLTLWSDIPRFDWDAYKWKTNYKSVSFAKISCPITNRKSKPDADQLMDPIFTEFAKAYLRYSQTIRPNKSIHRTLNALQTMEASLGPNITLQDIVRFDQRNFIKATSFANRYVQRQSICSALLSILKTMSDFLIATGDVYGWKNPFVRQFSYDAERGTKAPQEIKARKIPNQNALLAIADVFSRGETEILSDVDIMVTSITGILLSTPMRINEVLRLRTDALRSSKDKNGEIQNYIAYWVPKTRDYDRKAIPKSMSYVCNESFRRLIQITEEGRKLANYMETQPDKFYRHENCPCVPDDQILTPKQTSQALGFKNAKYCESFLYRHTGSFRVSGFTLDKLWQLVLIEHKQKNPHFPYQESPQSAVQPPLKMSESLLCFRHRQLSYQQDPSPVILQPFGSSQYTNRLIIPPDKRNAGYYFFPRNGFDAMVLKSHSIRTLLNRIARRSGVGIETITAWSSRASVLQTRTYLHDSPEEFAIQGAHILNTIQDQKTSSPISEQDAEAQTNGPYHRSRYGLCRRSWRVGPCNKFADCLNCSELLMCKGDKLALKTVEQDYQNLMNTYTSAVNAIKNGERSASIWTEKAAYQITKIQQLMSVLNDSSIPPGSPITVAGEDFSHEKVLIAEKANAYGIEIMDRSQLAIDYGDELLACLEHLGNKKDAKNNY